MALYQYVKAPPEKYRAPRARRSMTSFILMGFGAGILLWVMWPIVSFSVTTDSVFSKIVTPVSETAYAASSVNSLVSSDDANYANANMWYPTSPQKHASPMVNTYTLSIPKLKIQNALVTIAGEDLGASLVHYGGTGLPGQYGNTVIFGHSTLPQFFSTANYKTIFSLLPTLKIGDEILVNYDGVDYRYTIYEMMVLESNDLSALEQRFDDSYVTLVTCVPPGTYWKRLNVRAKLSII